MATRKANKNIDVEYLRENLRYNPKTGVWTWIKPRPKIRVGQRAGTVSPRGYRVVWFEGMGRRSGRLAWFYMTGKWPQQEIDHVNRRVDDDRWINLRESNRTGNNQNQKRRSDNTTGFTGVHWCNTWNKYVAQISVNGKRTKLGSYSTAVEARNAYITAARVHFGKFFSGR